MSNPPTTTTTTVRADEVKVGDVIVDRRFANSHRTVTAVEFEHVLVDLDAEPVLDVRIVLGDFGGYISDDDATFEVIR